MALLVASASLVASTTVLPTVDAASIVPFVPARFPVNDNGAIAMFGNNLMTCPPSTACTAALAGSGSGSALNNNDYVMTNVDEDLDGTTFNSSSSTVTLLPDSTVLFAGLYWGARTTAGTGGQATTANRQTVAFEAPGDAGTGR